MGDVGLSTPTRVRTVSNSLTRHIRFVLVPIAPHALCKIAMVRGSFSIHPRRRLFPFVERIFADAGYQGAKAATAIAKSGDWKLEIVKRNELRRFVVLPKRWVVEKNPGLDQSQSTPRPRLRRYARTAAAFARLAMIRTMLRRLTRPAHYA